MGGLANTSLAACELRAGDHQQARRRLCGAIDHWQRAGVRTQQWLAVRLLIEALDRDGEHESIAVLAGAYEATSAAGPAYGEDADRLTEAAARAERSLGTERFRAATARGATMTDDQAAALAVSLGRCPGAGGAEANETSRRGQATDAAAARSAATAS